MKRTQGFFNCHPAAAWTAPCTAHDLADPADPQVVNRFEVPSALAGGGWGYGVAGCAIDVG